MICVVLVQAAKVQLPTVQRTPRTLWQTLWEGAFVCCISPADDQELPPNRPQSFHY
jgi:hypothetical protein